MENDLASVTWDQGQLGEARKLYESSIALPREIGEKANVAESLGNLAALQTHLGELAAAETRAEEARKLNVEIALPDRAAVSTLRLAELKLRRGDLANARKEILEAAAVLRKGGDRANVAVALSDLFEIQLLEGDPGAAATLKEVREIQTALSNKRGIPDTAPQESRLAFEAGRMAAAEAQAREAAEAYAGYGIAPGEALARAQRARPEGPRRRRVHALPRACPGARAFDPGSHDAAPRRPRFRTDP